MNRGSTVEFQDELIKPQNMPVHLVSIHLDTATTYLNDSYKTIRYEGNDYLGVGHFMGFSNIQETVLPVISSMTLSLSGVAQENISLVLNNEYIDRKVKVLEGFLDEQHNLVDYPIVIFSGLMDTPTITEDPDANTATVSVAVTNAFANFDYKTGRRGNDTEQQIHYPGDKGFEFAHLNTSGLIWGHN